MFEDRRGGRMRLAKIETGAAPDEMAQLRQLIYQIIQDEFCGSACTGIWARAVSAATDRIMRTIYSGR
jgi:hypothetical protein